MHNVVPIRYLVSLVVFLVGQFSMVLAFFLPLKVIIILGTEGLPGYLHPYIEESQKDLLTIYLASAALGFYTIFLLSDWCTNTISGSAAEKVRRRAKKISFFEGEEKFAKDVFFRLMRMTGSFSLVLGRNNAWSLPKFLGLFLSYSVGCVRVLDIVKALGLPLTPSKLNSER